MPYGTTGFLTARAAIGVLMSLAVAAVPASAKAAPETAPAREAAAGDEAAAEPVTQGELWRDAQAKLGTSDYQGAIGQLSKLYELVVHDPEAGALRTRVRVALHEAHIGAYGIDNDREHLRTAIDLLDKSLSTLSPEEEQQRAELESMRAQAQTLLEAHHEPPPIPPPTPDPVKVDEPEPELDPETELGPATVQPTDERAGRPLIISGAVLIGVGAIGGALLVGGLASASGAVGRFETDPGGREDARDDIRRGNAIGIAGAVVGSVFTVAGAVLLGIGLRRRSFAVGPTGDAQSGGVAWVGRF